MVGRGGIYGDFYGDGKPVRDLSGLPRYGCKRCSTAISEVEHTQDDDLCINCRQGLDPRNRPQPRSF